MAVEPTGCLNLAEKNLRDLLAGCAAVRTWLEVSTEGQAKARMHYGPMESPGDATCPLISIAEEGPGQLDAYAGGSGASYELSNVIAVVFVAAFDAQKNMSDNITTFNNGLSTAILAVSQSLGVAGNFFASEIPFEHTVVSHADEHPDQPRYIEKHFTFSYTGSPLQ